MKVIYKYPVGEEIDLPCDHKVLKAEYQGTELFAWVLVDLESETEKYKFVIKGTGHPEGLFYDEGEYVDTVFEGPYVWHIFKVKKIANGLIQSGWILSQKEQIMDEQIRIIVLKKCEEIVDWSEDNKWFNSSMIMDFVGILEDESRILTSKQITAVNNIYKKTVEKEW